MPNEEPSDVSLRDQTNMLDNILVTHLYHNISKQKKLIVHTFQRAQIPWVLILRPRKDERKLKNVPRMTQ